jgi:hypothetical protein
MIFGLSMQVELAGQTPLKEKELQMVLCARLHLANHGPVTCNPVSSHPWTSHLDNEPRRPRASRWILASSSCNQLPGRMAAYLHRDRADRRVPH